MQVTVITHDNEVLGVFAKLELAVAHLYEHGYETEEDWLEGGFEVSTVTVEGL